MQTESVTTAAFDRAQVASVSAKKTILASNELFQYVVVLWGTEELTMQGCSRRAWGFPYFTTECKVKLVYAYKQAS